MVPANTAQATVIKFPQAISGALASVRWRPTNSSVLQAGCADFFNTGSRGLPA